MELELNRSQARDRGSPYAGPGESRGMSVFGNRGPGHRRWELPFGVTARHGTGTRSGTMFFVLSLVGIGLAARRGRPGGVREYGTTTTYLWECHLAQGSSECACLYRLGTFLGTPRLDLSGIIVSARVSWKIQ